VSGWNALAFISCVACSSGGSGGGSGAAGSVGTPKDHAPSAELAVVKPGAMCVTHGKIRKHKDQLAIDDPTVRAFAPGSDGDAAALRFTYRGPASEEAKLKSGQVRRQVGLKLRAENGCNLVYVMWRLSPAPGLEVSVKRNPDGKDNGDCGTEGYTKIKPTAERLVSIIGNDVEHVLQAEISGDLLTAWVDGHVAWEGKLTADARDLAGPAGMRSDNMSLDAELLAAGAASGTVTCEQGDHVGGAR
jgi:hypothetical protein